MDDLCETHPTRRAILGAAGALFAWPFMPRGAFAAGPASDRRFLVIVLRGGLDGLAAVPPVGDPGYVALREPLLIPVGGERPALPLDGFFAAHPAMPNLARMFRAGHALVAHANTTGYRGRSHFSGQEILESGQERAGLVDSGFLNRAFALLAPAGQVARRDVLGVGVTPPLVVRGPHPTVGWAPQGLPAAGPPLLKQVLDLYDRRDPFLHERLAAAFELDAAAGAAAPAGPSAESGEVRAMRATGASVARLFAADDGPRVGALAFDGWDTHVFQGGPTGRLATLLSGLDAALAALEEGLGAIWSRTAIAVVTEFGRTARINGSLGSDHGTGTTAFLVGGAVAGGRVIADWPGLRAQDLFENRDLKATTDLRALIKGVLADLYGLSPRALGRDVYPGTEGLAPMTGLIRAL